MQFTKPMIELVYEIRRRVDADLKPAIKLANPEMLQELGDFYGRSKDVVTKALVKELFHLAGDEWVKLLDGENPITSKPHVQVYRGQTSLSKTADATKADDQPAETAVPSASDAPKSQRIYRGRIVTS